MNMNLTFLKSMGLKSKLIITMMTLVILSSVTLFQISQNAQKRLIKEVEDSLDDLTKAIQVSVQKMTSEDEIDQGKLKELIDRFKKKGINEISILSENREIIASSNPGKIGQSMVKNLKETDFLIKAELGKKSTAENAKEFNIPIIIGNENYGYISIVMHLENLARIQKRNFYLRLLSTLVIFLAGTIVIIIVANKYTRPIQDIVDATKRISREELVPLTLEKNVSPEIKELILNFNDMVHKLIERKKLETRIKEMEHMFQVGQLSSAIAHEIKNPLNFMSLAVSQIKDETSEIKDSPMRELRPVLCALEDEIRKLNSLVTNFLEFGKPLKLKMEYLSLNDVVSDLLRLVGAKLNDLNIAVKFSHPGETNIIGDREKLSGCLLNLILNSIDSIKENGDIEIQMKAERDVAVITFRDTGHGIPEGIRDKIFEPYFSSKTAGMGLGLAITKKILLEHGGDIWLNGDYTDGAEFILSLPKNI
jgi:signal transduction histidine kinase